MKGGERGGRRDMTEGIQRTGCYKKWRWMCISFGFRALFGLGGFLEFPSQNILQVERTC